jgi:hypothetical protein
MSTNHGSWRKEENQVCKGGRGTPYHYPNASPYQPFERHLGGLDRPRGLLSFVSMHAIKPASVPGPKVPSGRAAGHC